MNIRRAGRKVVKNLHKGYGIYRIGFVNIYGEEDETELDAMNINDLERLWLSLCPEFECKGNSVCYVERGRLKNTRCNSGKKCLVKVIH